MDENEVKAALHHALHGAHYIGDTARRPGRSTSRSRHGLRYVRELFEAEEASAYRAPHES